MKINSFLSIFFFIKYFPFVNFVSSVCLKILQTFLEQINSLKINDFFFSKKLFDFVEKSESLFFFFGGINEFILLFLFSFELFKLSIDFFVFFIVLLLLLFKEEDELFV